jgi:hypothetical protein
VSGGVESKARMATRERNPGRIANSPPAMSSTGLAGVASGPFTPLDYAGDNDLTVAFEQGKGCYLR